MSNAGAVIQGVSELMKQLQAIIPTPEETKKTLTHIATPMMEQIKANAPVDKNTQSKYRGALRESVQLIKIDSSKTVVIGINRKVLKRMKAPINLDYLVEYGTSHSMAQPFIRNAYDGGKQQVLTNLEKDFETLVQKKIDSI